MEPACYLTKIRDSESLHANTFSCSFIENFVVDEIRKRYINNNKEFDVYYYRDNNQNAIDHIVLENSELTLIEIKKGVSFNFSYVPAFKQ